MGEHGGRGRAQQGESFRRDIGINQSIARAENSNVFCLSSPTGSGAGSGALSNRKRAGNLNEENSGGGYFCNNNNRINKLIQNLVSGKLSKRLSRAVIVKGKAQI